MRHKFQHRIVDVVEIVDERHAKQQHGNECQGGTHLMQVSHFAFGNGKQACGARTCAVNIHVAGNVGVMPCLREHASAHILLGVVHHLIGVLADGRSFARAELSVEQYALIRRVIVGVFNVIGVEARDGEALVDY